MEARNILRAWLAFTILQLLGNLYYCYDPKLFVSKMVRHGATAGLFFDFIFEKLTFDLKFNLWLKFWKKSLDRSF